MNVQIYHEIEGYPPFPLTYENRGMLGKVYLASDGKYYETLRGERWFLNEPREIETEEESK